MFQTAAHATVASPRAQSPASQILTALPQPLLVLLPDRRLVFTNPGAEHLLRDGRVMARAGRVMQLGQLDATRLDQLLHLATAGSSSHAGLWFSPQLDTGWLHVSPLAPALVQGTDWSAEGVLLVVHLDQPALTQAARIDALTRHCRLSPTERHVLMLLADGLSVERAAQQLGLCLSTLRSHVRNLLGKTQAPTLMQLLRWTGSAQALPH